MAALDSLIVSTPGNRGGKPRIADTRIAVSDVVLWHLRMGKSVEEIAATYQLSLAAVYAALAYYYENQAAIDRSIEESEAFVEAFFKDRPSLLREKLKAVAGD